jgi:hypothetical protein
MDRATAESLKRLGLDAVTSLSKLLELAKKRCSDEEFQRIKKGVGLTIGKIETDVLGELYKHFPDLADS